ncbi:PREDICTED: U6 snRNA phosphodiesterase-like [Amphimedon queenslandica]|uniref:U6 snRNA phosphodiesterase 1 n=2 Tax=Amphimedon queenslandica TaxID=400682 RepID=A0AAN0ITS4_AMPQE|nr:PREDICTED: U6 snRNA phosphodiesterase-like [Amphimedon queenslandica]|eukprot:XP_011408967.2 PREDICTED: U6 snRNA phosphodiesterase-like [Amphimedon queenslandica]
MADSRSLHLVSYSSSSDSSGSEETPPVIKKYKENTSKPLELPGAIANMFSEGDHIDVAEDHDGRKRSFAHVRGNWPTYIYIPITFPDGFNNVMESFLKKSSQDVIPFQSQFHLSLSRTVPIQYHWIQPLTASLMESITNNHKRYIKKIIKLNKSAKS